MALVLGAAAIDFLVGPAIKTVRPDFERYNITIKEFGYNSTIFEQNLYEDWTLVVDAGIQTLSVTKIHEYFVVFGIIFPSITGDFAGVNMSGDLKHPAKVNDIIICFM